MQEENNKISLAEITSMYDSYSVSPGNAFAYTNSNMIFNGNQDWVIQKTRQTYGTATVPTNIKWFETSKSAVEDTYKNVLFETVVDGNHFKMIKMSGKFVLLKNDNIEYEYTDDEFMKLVLDYNSRIASEEGMKLLKLL